MIPFHPVLALCLCPLVYRFFPFAMVGFFFSYLQHDIYFEHQCLFFGLFERVCVLESFPLFSFSPLCYWIVMCFLSFGRSITLTTQKRNKYGTRHIHKASVYTHQKYHVATFLHLQRILLNVQSPV